RPLHRIGGHPEGLPELRLRRSGPPRHARPRAELRRRADPRHRPRARAPERCRPPQPAPDGPLAVPAAPWPLAAPLPVLMPARSRGRPGSRADRSWGTTSGRRLAGGRLRAGGWREDGLGPMARGRTVSGGPAHAPTVAFSPVSTGWWSALRR